MSQIHILGTVSTNVTAFEQAESTLWTTDWQAVLWCTPVAQNYTAHVQLCTSLYADHYMYHHHAHHIGDCRPKYEQIGGTKEQ